MPDKRKQSSELWIFDTVVLSNFLLTGAEDVLIKRYRNRGAITSEVYAEIDLGIAKGHALRQIDGFIAMAKFKTLTINSAERIFFTQLLTNLDIGEASCLAIAKSRNAVMVTDDRAARSISAEYGIRFTGTVGILKASCLEKLISAEKADAILKRMIASGFYSPVNSISDIL